MPTNETIYCGIDFHKNTSTLCALKANGEQVELVTLKTSNLVKYLSNRKNYLIGIEASGGTNDMVQRLKLSGHDVKIINTNKFKAIGIGGKKTDKKDSRAMAECLRLNYIPEVHHKSEYARQLKSLLVGREMIVRTRVNLSNHVRGVLREYGITMPQGLEEFKSKVRESIDKLECELIRDHLLDLVERVMDLLKREKQIEDQMKIFCKEDTRVSQLQTIPGIGPMSALAFVAVIDDHSRFKNSKYFASYLGLVPKEFSSADKRRMGSITRSGSELLRRYLIHGARAVLKTLNEDRAQKDKDRRWAFKLKQKVGMNKAAVALAHRLARIGFAVLNNQQTYNGQLETVIKEAA